MFDDVNDLIPEISEKLKQNNFSIIINKKHIELNFEPKIKNIQNISLIINNKDNYLNSKNNDSLYEIINNLSKDNE